MLSSLFNLSIFAVFALSDISLEGLKAFDFCIRLQKSLTSKSLLNHGWNIMATAPTELANM
jgi:hypothetical protein